MSLFRMSKTYFSSPECLSIILLISGVISTLDDFPEDLLVFIGVKFIQVRPSLVSMFLFSKRKISPILIPSNRNINMNKSFALSCSLEVTSTFIKAFILSSLKVYSEALLVASGITMLSYLKTFCFFLI